jgi:hypothetical protein
MQCLMLIKAETVSTHIPTPPSPFHLCLFPSPHPSSPFCPFLCELNRTGTDKNVHFFLVFALFRVLSVTYITRNSVQIPEKYIKK